MFGQERCMAQAIAMVRHSRNDPDQRQSDLAHSCFNIFGSFGWCANSLGKMVMLELSPVALAVLPRNMPGDVVAFHSQLVKEVVPFTGLLR